MSAAILTVSMVASLTEMAISTNASPQTMRVNAPMRSSKCSSSMAEKASARCNIAIEAITSRTRLTAERMSRPDSGSGAATKKQTAVTALRTANRIAYPRSDDPLRRAARKYMKPTVRSRKPYSVAR